MQTMKKIALVMLAFIATVSIYSCGGTSNPTETTSSPATPSKVTGDVVYKKTCITCHQANGEGLPNTYPPLAKSDFISDKEKTIAQVIKGYSGELTVNGKKYNSAMPAQQLNDEEVAAVLTYVYGNFGNGGTTVTPDEVKAVRGKI